MDDDDIAIAATCLLWSCTSQVDMSIWPYAERKKTALSVGLHLSAKNRHQYIVYTTLLPHLADYHISEL